MIFVRAVNLIFYGDLVHIVDFAIHTSAECCRIKLKQCYSIIISCVKPEMQTFCTARYWFILLALLWGMHSRYRKIITHTNNQAITIRWTFFFPNCRSPTSSYIHHIMLISVLFSHFESTPNTVGLYCELIQCPEAIS